MATLIKTHETAPTERSRPWGAQRQSPARQAIAGGLPVDRVARGLGWFSVGLGVAELVAPGVVARICGTRNHASLIRSFGVRELAAGVGLLTAPNPAPWLWSRVAGDALDLAALGGTLSSSRNERGWTAFAIASVAGVTVLDVLCATKSTQGPSAARAEASLIVNRSPEECYTFWRNLENLPRFMKYLETVRTTGERRSHWIVNSGNGMRLEWDAEIETDIPNQRISWRSVANADVSHSGSVEFERAPGGRGTIVRVQIDYGNLLHSLASAAATLIGRHPEQVLRKELYHFRQVLETGEMITTEGQPAGRRSGATWLDQIAR
jgi:uncharacterized membrane protein